VRECGRCEGRSAPSLYCWYVWIGSLIHLVIAPTSRSIPKLQHYHGKQLYRATETRIRQSLVENLVLWVFEKNTRARSFYEAVGYRLESGKQKEARFAGATTAMEVRYRKPLNGETALAMR
jgi:ribosomal protein S18 acetylase RimI-like enzyme